jgi:hypothetical protein
VTPPTHLEITSASASVGCAVCKLIIPDASDVIMQVLFGALRCCQRHDLRQCALLDGSVFEALAGTAATLTVLDCEGIGMVRFAA